MRATLASIAATLVLALTLCPPTAATGGARGDLISATRVARLAYETVDTDGTTPRTASGLLVVPDTKVRRLRVVAWEHGTTLFKGDAPSKGADADARLISYVISGSGFIVVAPDYLGLGVGPGSHPYNQRSSEVTASIDMLRAARTFLTGIGRPWDRRLLVAGFSQGGKSRSPSAQRCRPVPIPT